MVLSALLSVVNGKLKLSKQFSVVHRWHVKHVADGNN